MPDTAEPDPSDPKAIDAAYDPRGLIREAFVIEGITEPDCRSIFFDWAMGLPDGTDMAAGITAMLARHPDDAAHPMRKVLEEGLGSSGPGGRQGRRARRAPQRYGGEPTE